MRVVEIRAFNDHWYNREEVEELCVPIKFHETVCFRILEGVCAYHTGIYQWIRQWQQKTGRPTHSIRIDTLNKTQPLPWKNINKKSDLFLEHFIDSRVYLPRWQHRERHAQAKKFALFVGRRCVSRCVMMHDCTLDLAGDCLISAMITDQIDWYEPPGELARWGDQTRLQQIQYWNATSCPGSLDHCHVRDIYVNYEQFHFITALNPFYHLFDIELVAETMLRGATFWPTEKIVRPMVAKKPWIVMGARGFLSNLRDMGFKTFGDHWDERYDVLEGEHRWDAIRTVLADIRNQSQIKYKKMLKDLTTVCEHNYNHLKTWWSHG